MEELKDKFITKETYPRLADAEIEDYAEILGTYTKPEEWLGHISGNHPLVMTEYGVDPVERLCMMLKHRYLGYSAFVPLNIQYGHTIISCMILCHHGFGGGGARKEGSGLNAYVDHALRYEGWDLALYGHRHDRFSKTISRIKPQSGGVKVNPGWVRAVDRKVAQCGTYMRTLSRSKYPTYAEKFGYPPRALGCLIERIGICRDRTDGKDYMAIRFLGSNE